MAEDFILNELSKKFNGDENAARQLNPLILASIGDAVYSLSIRCHMVANHDFNAHMLHMNSAKMVRASAQKEAYYKIENFLLELLKEDDDKLKESDNDDFKKFSAALAGIDLPF